MKTGKVLFEWRSDERVASAEPYAPMPKEGTTPWYAEFEPDGTAVLDGNLAGRGSESYRAFLPPGKGSRRSRPQWP